MGMEIPLSDGSVAVVDDADAALISGRTLTISDRYVYSRRMSNGKRVWTYLARLIAQPAQGEVVDHINGDRLDNRRANLRIVTQAENTKNRRKQKTRAGRPTCGYKGVNRATDRAGWAARIAVDGKRISLGYHLDLVDAAKAYDDAARRFFGEHAALNFPRAGEQHA